MIIAAKKGRNMQNYSNKNVNKTLIVEIAKVLSVINFNDKYS